MSKRAVADATRSWIRQFVVREGLCPFAAASRVLVRVDDFDSDGRELANRAGARWRLDPLRHEAHAELALAALDRAERWVDQLLSKDMMAHPSSNLFVVWPVGVADYSAYLGMAAALADLHAHLTLEDVLSKARAQGERKGRKK